MANKISLYRGVNYPSVYQHTDSTGAALPLTGCTLYFTIKPTPYDDDTVDSTATFQAVVTTHTNAAAGLTGWNTIIPATGIAPGKYYYDIVIKDASNKELPPVLIGECQIVGKRTNK